MIENRAAYGLPALKIWTFSKGKEDNKTVTLSDFSPAAMGEMENHFLPNCEMEHEGGLPYSLDFFET